MLHLGGRLVLVFSALPFAVGCSASTEVAPDAATLGDAGDASLTAQESAAAPSALGDASDTEGALADRASAPIPWDGRVPAEHRASASTCPQTRDAGVGFACPDSGAPRLPSNPCTVDSDCTGGMDGLCLCTPDLISPPSISPPNTGQDGGLQGQDSGLSGLYTGTVCSYDECLSDSDCGLHVPCDCRDPNIYGQPNVCLAASNCAVDSDCPPPGFCSESVVFGQSPDIGFFCHTPNDVCVDDSDCVFTGPNRGMCEFDVTNKIWDCVEVPLRP